MAENETPYKSNKLALKSAGDYGNKPITSILTEFIKELGILRLSNQTSYESISDSISHYL